MAQSGHIYSKLTEAFSYPYLALSVGEVEGKR